MLTNARQWSGVAVVIAMGLHLHAWLRKRTHHAAMPLLLSGLIGYLGGGRNVAVLSQAQANGQVQQHILGWPTREADHRTKNNHYDSN